MRNFKWIAAGFIVLLAHVDIIAQAAWPKEIPFKNGGKVIVYQPQPERLEGNRLFGRSAVAVRETEKADLVFGAVFYEAFMSTDKSTRMASLDSIRIHDAKFDGGGDSTKIERLKRFMEVEIPKWKLVSSLDAIVATIDREFPDAEIYNNDPPKIYFRKKATSLVIVDGDPKVKYDENLKADRVLNTPNLIFKENGQWKMYNGGLWYSSASITDGWRVDNNLSEKLKSINEQIKKQEKENNGGKDVTGTPQVTDIIVSTVPAELIQTRGEPVYKQIEGTGLSYVDNTENHILVDDSEKKFYILIAGRWFKSSSLDGPWTFNEPDKLPEGFALIPPGHEKDAVLASVAGTDAANEAMIDAIIPQTAKVDRKTATVKVEYDGEPKFTRIEGTNLERAENSPVTVFKEEGGKYYALDNGVWYTGASAKGPWQSATERPAQVDKIPMTDPTYNAKFVYIYEVTPEYTVQGYTGGYLNCFIQGDPVVIYGTGFYYRPWYGVYYYPYAWTWGFGYMYTPYYGWAVPYAYNPGYIHFSFSFGYYGGWGYGYGGWCGPPMYHPPYYHHPPGGWYGGYPPYNGRPGYDRPGYGPRPTQYDRQNLYRDKPGVSTMDRQPGAGARPGASDRMKPSTGVGTGAKPAARPSNNASNNIYADKAGNVYQRDKQGSISQRDNKAGSWNNTGNVQPRPSQPTSKPAQPTTRPTQPSTRPTQPTTRPSQPSTYPSNNANRAPSGSVNRDMQMRDRSASRTSNYSSTQRSYSRPSGGSSGGGRRR